MVLVPEIVDAVGDDAHVLAAGGIGSGRQIAAALALGAGGRVDGLVLADHVGVHARRGRRDEAGAASRRGSDQTVRARVYSGKPARLLKTKWTDAWAEPGAPDAAADAAAEPAGQRGTPADHALPDDPDVVAMPVGQIVGRMNSVRPVAEMMAELVAEFDETLARLDKLR